MLELSARAYQVQEDEVKIHASVAADAEQRFAESQSLVNFPLIFLEIIHLGNV